MKASISSQHGKNTLQLPNRLHPIQSRCGSKQVICLNFICTHNSRRSHLSQVWAQALAIILTLKMFFVILEGTESTALFPAAAKTLETQWL